MKPPFDSEAHQPTGADESWAASPASPRAPAPQARVGRGATMAPSPRYLPVVREGFDDGWGTLDDLSLALPKLETIVTTERTRSPVARNQSPDVPFSVSINPYKGCEHGCVYCFARPTHAYLDLSPGLDFESRLVAKPELPGALRTLLGKPSWQPQVIALGANTDAYQPIERDWQIARQVLQVLGEFRNPVGVITKSHLVVRDVDLLAPLAAQGLAHVFVSLTTLDRKLARTMEPRAASPEKRLETIRILSQAGIPVGVMVAPVIPGINDQEMEAILKAARAAGARTAGKVLLRLPLELKELFEGWLDAHFPNRKDKVLNLIRDARGGKLYDATWGTRMRGEGPYADLLQRRFAAAKAREGYEASLPLLRTDLFAVPEVPRAQLELFGD